MTSIRSLTKLALCAVFALGFLCTAQAEEKKSDATGTWTWTRPGRNGGAEVKMTLKLKVEGDMSNAMQLQSVLGKLRS